MLFLLFLLVWLGLMLIFTITLTPVVRLGWDWEALEALVLGLGKKKRNQMG